MRMMNVYTEINRIRKEIILNFWDYSEYIDANYILRLADHPPAWNESSSPGMTHLSDHLDACNLLVEMNLFMQS